MNYFSCGVVEVRGVKDQLGTVCGSSAKTLCYDCGTSLCPAHTEHCELCTEIFCQSCLSFHQGAHPKPAQRSQLTEKKKRTA